VFVNIDAISLFSCRNFKMAPAEEDLKKRVGRKLTKRNRPPYRMPSAHIPERLRQGDDEQEDVTAPAPGSRVAPQYMNQSIFSMIAAAGSRTDFHARFDESSDSEDEEKQDRGRSHLKSASEGGVLGSQLDRHTTSVLEMTPSGDKKHKRKLSEHRLLQKLSLKPQKGRGDSSSRGRSPASNQMSGSPESMTPQDAPMLSRMLTAQAEFDANALDTDALPPSEDAEKRRRRADSSPATLLALRLMEIFEFEKPEKVVSEYPCWLLQSVLLQGYMYITQNHICFYAYLPKKSNIAAKTGYLSKRGRQNPKYNRYWFTLKGDVLSYYSNPSDLYFPHGNVDLRYGISASLAGDREKQKETKDFIVTTDHRTYNFRADSATSAREWVRLLQKVIFRSHNDGDSVKISLPIENVIDIEESPVVEFAQTFKIRVIESGDSYAVDEVCINVTNLDKAATNS
jgi:sterol 3beta-glucosyltransferase